MTEYQQQCQTLSRALKNTDNNAASWLGYFDVMQARQRSFGRCLLLLLALIVGVTGWHVQALISDLEAQGNAFIGTSLFLFWAILCVTTLSEVVTRWYCRHPILSRCISTLRTPQGLSEKHRNDHVSGLGRALTYPPREQFQQAVFTLLSGAIIAVLLFFYVPDDSSGLFIASVLCIGLGTFIHRVGVHGSTYSWRQLIQKSAAVIHHNRSVL